MGQAVLLKGEPYTVIGVLPDNANTPLNADLYIALQASREGEGKATNFSAVLRLRDGATWQQANAEMNRAFSQSQGATLDRSWRPGDLLFRALAKGANGDARA